MLTLEEKIKKLSSEDDYAKALKFLVKEYLKMKVYKLKIKNLQFEDKWNEL